VWPGAVLLDGEIQGTWRRAHDTVTIRTWNRLAPAARAAVEAEAAALPLPGVEGGSASAGTGEAAVGPHPPGTPHLGRLRRPMGGDAGIAAGGALGAYERRARDVLPEEVYDFFAGGAGAEQTVASNLSAWAELELRPRILRDVEAVDMSVDVLGTRLAAPLMVAPTASQRLAHPDGELATARAVAAAGSLFVISTRASATLGDIAAAAPTAPRWFQVYVMRDRGWTAELVVRARETGCSALVLTADTPFAGTKLRASQAAFEIPDDIWMVNRSDRVVSAGDGEDQDPSIGFGAVEWLREVSGGLPVVVKGVLRGDDASACIAAGAAAIVVSNHGGRQLDGAVATARALPQVVEAVAGRAEVYVDGGVRRGVDILRALALGARAVMVGRPVLWGLACGGQAGVRAVLGELHDQLREAAALAGAAEVEQITADLVVPWRGSD
jgi:4-hydroxymandelate oxidase